MHNIRATIAAVSTPPGKGGVALIRVSGADAFAICDKVFIPKGKKPLSAVPPRMQVYGDIMYEGQAIDDAMAVRFVAPHSYTGEDTVEMTCHGGVLLTRTVLTSLFTAGAVPAEAGEYTRRAFVNGKLTLTDAESIGQLLDAVAPAQIRLARKSARNRLSEAIDGIRTDLVGVMSSVYARIDYPDEDLGEFTDEETVEALLGIREAVDKLMKTYRTGHAVAEGIPTVICGKPNAGKSSLFNALLGEDAAIVTDIAGTTRDAISRTATLGEVTLLLTDTAGLHETADTVERLGVERAKQKAETAELIFAVFDTSRPMDEEDRELLSYLETLPAVKIAIANKSDLPAAWQLSDVTDMPIVTVSARTGDLSSLEEKVRSLFIDGALSFGDDAVVTTARQAASLAHAKENVQTAIDAYRMGMPADAASSDLELAIGALSETDGKAVSDAVISDIFSKFCVGK